MFCFVPLSNILFVCTFLFSRQRVSVVVSLVVHMVELFIKVLNETLRLAFLLKGFTRATFDESCGVLYYYFSTIL